MRMQNDHILAVFELLCTLQPIRSFTVFKKYWTERNIHSSNKNNNYEVREREKKQPKKKKKLEEKKESSNDSKNKKTNNYMKKSFGSTARPKIHSTKYQ